MASSVASKPAPKAAPKPSRPAPRSAPKAKAPAASKAPARSTPVGRDKTTVSSKATRSEKPSGKGPDISKWGKPEKAGKADEPGKAEKPGKADEPGKAEKPGKADEPGKAEKPGKADEPGKAEKPGKADEPGKVEKPDKADEPGKAEKPGKADEPDKAEKPDDKKEKDEKSNSGIWNAIHTGLDIAGQVPALGIVPDLINAGLYGLRGDKFNAGISLAGAVPVLGNAATGVRLGAKAVKLGHTAASALKLEGQLAQAGKVLGKAGPAVRDKALGALEKMRTGAAKAFEKNPAWKAKADKLQLPTDGAAAFHPPKKWNPNNPQKGANGGYLDAYGNEWKKGPSRTDGQHFEWDVVPRSKDSGFASFSRDGSHVNVSLDGSITHR